MNIIKLQKKLENFIKFECANHFNNSDGISNYCCLENTENYICIYFPESESESEPESENNNRCGYFEKHVLPIDTDLKYLYELQYIYNEDDKTIKEKFKSKKKTGVIL